jgi:hypothetical protein
MTILDEKQQSPSLGLIATFVSIVTAIAFGGVWAFSHASSTAPQAQIQQQEAPATVEGNI